MKITPEIIPNYAEIDMEICTLRGEGSADFIILCVNGEPFKSYGTPYDTPRRRVTYDAFVKELNRPDSLDWPEFFDNWKAQFVKDFNLPEDSTAILYKPVFSWRISRVCHGYSEHLHAAVNLLESLMTEGKLIHWQLKRGTTSKAVHLVTPSTDTISERGESMPLAIAKAVLRVLKTEH